MKPYYEEAGITIYHGDCREVLPLVSADAVVTDPPYGVMLGQVDNGQARQKNQKPYTLFEDSPAYVGDVVVPAVVLALTRCKRGAITPGSRNAWAYPQPADVGVWWVPNGSSRGRWGWLQAHLILYYGADPRNGCATPNSCTLPPRGTSDEHPCAKPESVSRWLVNKASLEGETILDPFAGSGTFLWAAKQLGRRAIGIEIEERYCEIAASRLRQGVLDLA